MTTSTQTQNAAVATQTASFFTTLGFSEYTTLTPRGDIAPKFFLYSGNDSKTGSREEIISHLRSLLDSIPAAQESLTWEGRGGTWYSGDDARAAINAEISDPCQEEVNS